MTAQTIVVAGRGQVTLPAALRKKYALEEGTPLLIEDTPQGILLRRGTVVPIELYSDADIEDWVKADIPTKKDRSWLKPRKKS